MNTDCKNPITRIGAGYSGLICTLRHLMAPPGAPFQVAKLEGERSLRELAVLDIDGLDTVEHDGQLRALGVIS